MAKEDARKYHEDEGDEETLEDSHAIRIMVLEDANLALKDEVNGLRSLSNEVACVSNCGDNMRFMLCYAVAGK